VRPVSSRPHAVVRRAIPGDLPALLDLIAELRATSGRSARPFLRETLAFGERLGDLIKEQVGVVLVAESGTEAVGMAVLTPAPLTSLTDLPALRMDYVLVARRVRRRGVGRALVAAAAGHAEESGVDHLAVAVVPADRESNRFYARLGFAPVLLRRSTSVTALLRKLSSTDRRTVVDDLTRRRLSRRPPGRRSVPGAAGIR
jgi:GNAT superfamily N-acetyltransferase